MISKKIHKISEKEMFDAYNLFLNTLSSKPRLRILTLLRRKEMNVSEIVKELKMSQTHASHNLNRLKSCGFVKDEIKGKFRYYKLNQKTIKPILNLIDKHMESHCIQIIKKLKGGRNKNENKK